jgi:ABC-type antimicrobial peptide transport system permease subunit
MTLVLAQSGVTLKDGRLPQTGTNGVALSEEIATALNLKIGDTFDRTKDEKIFTKIVIPLQLVGILSGDVRLGVISYEFLENTQSLKSYTDTGLLVISRPGRESAVADFLRQSIRNANTKTLTYQSVSDQTAKDQQLLFTIGLPIVILLAFAITLVIGTINQLSFAQRLSEFGILQAVGYGKENLIGRLTLETAAPAMAGWAGGLFLGFCGMVFLSHGLYEPKGFALDPFSLTAFLFVMVVPILVIGLTLFIAFRTLGHLDAIAVVERGELSMEKERYAQPGRTNPAGLPRPLASSTFYQRHPLQAAVLIGATVLLIVSTALLFFVFSAGADAMAPLLNNLSRMSAVSPNNTPLEESVVDQIRSNPSVERTINVYTFVPVKISIPPMFPDQPMETLCVSAEDMAYLVNLYHLTLAEGHLPQTNTNEIVLPWTAAKNRNIKVGDIIGDPANPIYPGAPSLPASIVVSGIFAPADSLSNETWLSFMSLEYADALREDNLSLIVVPRTGQKAELDSWLENQIAGDDRIVLTYGNQQAAFQKEMGSMLSTFGLMEFVIALMAALAMAGLNYFFIKQRQAEFGVLNALGFGRPQLVGRIFRETFYTTGAAWLISMLGCICIVFFLQQGLFASIGLRLNFFNPTPWMFTLPIPIAVLMVNVVSTLWMFSRLDPISIIERRT